LPEDATPAPLPNRPLDPVDELNRLDPPLEQTEQRPLVALVRRILAPHEPEIGGGTRKPLTIGRRKRRKDGEPTDILRRHHCRHHHPRGSTGPRTVAGTPERAP